MSMSHHAGSRDSGEPEVVPAAEAGRFRLMRMRPRDPDEPGRAATPLELFFDLVFVVAVSIAAINLHDALTEAHVLEGLLSYFLVFFAIVDRNRFGELIGFKFWFNRTRVRVIYLLKLYFLQFRFFPRCVPLSG